MSSMAYQSRASNLFYRTSSSGFNAADLRGCRLGRLARLCWKECLRRILANEREQVGQDILLEDDEADEHGRSLHGGHDNEDPLEDLSHCWRSGH